MVDRTSTRIANRARALRREMTDPEIMLWSRLKGRAQDQPIFRRQFAYQTIILDFYCPAAGLAVEVDGRTHWDEDRQAKDEARDRWLADQGIEVLRVGAGAVYRGVGSVADSVIAAAEARIRSRKSSG